MTASKTFQPFANEADALSLGEFTVENHLDHVALFGNLEIRRDADGLRQAKALSALLEAVVAVLSQPGALDAKDASDTSTTQKQVANPFGE